MWQTMILIFVVFFSYATGNVDVGLEEFRKYYTMSMKMKVTDKDFATSMSHCRSLRKGILADSKYRYEEQTVSLALLWNNTLEHAAAALLRATLLSVGYNEDIIDLYKRDSVDPAALDSHTLTVEVTNKPELLLQIRLSPRAAYIHGCKIQANRYWINSFDDDEDMPDFFGCDFPISDYRYKINIYIVDKMKDTCAAEQLRHTPAALSKTLQFVYVKHSELKELIRNSNNSFFFMDTYQPSNSTKVMPVVTIPMTLSNLTGFEHVENRRNCFSTEHKNSVLLKYAAGDNIGKTVSNTFIRFYPSIRELGSVLHEYNLRNQNNSDDDNMKEAACTWMTARIFNIFLNYYHSSIRNWRESASLNTFRAKVAVIICKIEAQDLKEYLYMMKVLEDYMNFTVSSLYDDTNKYLIQTFVVDCDHKINPFLVKLTDWFEKTPRNINNMQNSTSENIIDDEIPKIAVVTNDLAFAATQFATKLVQNLLIYDVFSGSFNTESEYSDENWVTLKSATGRVKHFIISLQRLLDNCGWQRLAIISESTQLADAVLAALRSPDIKLTLRYQKLFSTSDIPGILRELLNVDARVFLVNTGAGTAATILAAAKELEMTRDKGFVWILREYNTSDAATSAIRPYSLSFYWRGEREDDINNKRENKNKLDHYQKTNHKKITNEEAIRFKLEEKWRGRAWPLHAAPLLDSLFLINWLRNDFHYMADHISNTLPGINQNLTFNEVDGGVESPLIYLEQWGTEPRPRLLATWRIGEKHGPAEACPVVNPPSDGSASCLLPTGDPFKPNCREFELITAIFCTFIGTILVAIAIYCVRKAFLAYKLRIKTDYAKRMLAQRERVFEALAEHLVERTALELLQKLGSGRFGRVHQGLLNQQSGGNRQTVVAVKALREDASSAEENEFLREACTLATLEHEHIVRFLGVCVVDGPPLLLMEHAFYGDLLQYLQARRCLAEKPANTIPLSSFETDENVHVSAKSITKLALEAATALAYLSERGIVHRDVRASNCLVDERRCLKLADFGLARATGTADGEYQMCRRGVLPVLWMAPESLAKGVFTPASDVWSFGVLVFELVTLGRRPYGVQPPAVVLRHVVAGGQPQLPWDASAETQALARACWRRDPDARPTAAHLAHWLRTRWRALRPALVAELVDIDKLKNDNDFDDLDVTLPNTLPSQVLTTQPSSKIKFVQEYKSNLNKSQDTIKRIKQVQEIKPEYE